MDVMIIGGGASGMIAAVTAAESGDHVILFESQKKLGRKLLATGNGRCNLMNFGQLRYYGDSDFANQVCHYCSPPEVADFWAKLGLCLREEEQHRVYPCTFQAATVLDVLESAMKRYNVQILLETKVKKLESEGSHFKILTEDSRLFEGKRVIVATGGPAQPKLGGNRDGYSFLQQFSHLLCSASPALTPLKTDLRSISGLSGIRVHCKISLIAFSKIIKQEIGEILFTEDGVSGICAMQCARFVIPGECTAELDLVYDLFDHESSIVSYLLNLGASVPQEEPVSLLKGLCAPRLAWAVCKQAGLSMRGEKIRELNEQSYRSIAFALKHYRILITGTKGFDRAQVTAGGIDCKDWDPKRMESLLIPGLHAAGEVLNVDGDCGGYNLMFAWASGILAGRNGRGVV